MNEVLSIESRVREAIPYAPDLCSYDLGYRPARYWDQPVPSLIATVLPEHARQAAEQGDTGLFSAEQQRTLESIHPRFMSGAYLPTLEDYEVEIARIVMDSTTGDVVSFRALPGEGGGLTYRVADEYGDEGYVYFFDPEGSSEPLSFGEFLLLIASARRDDLPRAIDLGKAQEVRNFLTFSSAYYPELSRFFLEEEETWEDESCAADDN
ncbi:hypothetical protein EON82_15460 [bacterium]|nr:MAG: hypothetical protein EON82_15460 [bacterium]